MCDFIGLFFMKYSYFHIKNILKTFKSINYPLICVQEMVKIRFQQAWENTTQPTRTAARTRLANW